MSPLASASDQPLVVIAELEFAPEDRETVLALAQRHVRNTLAAEPGCLRFELITPEDDPGTLVCYEIYRGEADFAVHRQSPHLAWFREASAPYIRNRRIRQLRPVPAARAGAVLCAMPVLSRHKDYLDRLVEAGFEVRFNELGRAFTRAELIERLDGVVATLASVEPYDEAVFEAARDLRVIARIGVGYDQIDVPAATRHGVAVAMAFGTNHDAVADHTMALMGAISHRLVEYDRRVRERGWGSMLHGRMHGTTVGIIGFGRIGRAVAKRCQGFNMDVLVADPYIEADTVARLGHRLVELDELMRQADFVTVHAPLNPETRHLVDARRLSLMKPGAYLINTARGGLVDEAALAAALQAKQIAGAALDVFETEPLPESPLRQLDNAVLTPHVAGLSASALRAMAERCVESILAVTRGQDPGVGLVLNPEVLELRTA